MEFMSTVMASSFPSTNNQLRTSSNQRNQATIQDGRVTVQQVKGRQGQSFASTRTMGNVTSSKGNIAAGQARNDDLDAYDSDCDDIYSAKAVLMANLSSYDSDILSKVPHHDTYENDDMINQSVQETQCFEQPLIDYVPDNEITNKKYFDIQKKELSLDNDRLLDHIICQDVMNIVMHDNVVPANMLSASHKCLEDVHICVNSLATLTNYAKMEQDYINEYSENLVLKAELAKKEQMVEKKFFDEVVPRCSRLKNHNVNLELKLQHQKESFLNNRSFNNQNAPEIMENFKINEWQAKLDPKDVSIANLRKHIERDAHIDYIKHTQENADILQEYARALRPLDSDLDSACKYVQRIQEVLVYITATCPSLTKPSKKLVAITPLDKNKKVRFAKPATSSSNTQKQVVQTILCVRFGSDHIAKIIGYGDYQMGNVTIYRVYYVEGLGHNLFFIGQFCDSNFEVAFRKHTCYIRDLEGIDLLKGSRGSNLYTLSLEDMMLTSPICLSSKASKTKSWLWRQRLSHLNFDSITALAKQGLVRGLPKLKFQKDDLCSACALGKSKKHTHKPKAENSIQEKLYLLHMDLCGPMRIQSINGRKYILVIVDDYSRVTLVNFLRSKDEVLEFVILFLKLI
ncbi:retrovirus-related pol polyprotein from transposon TNT 1-94 [Tanacetum coccineum]|uniref:Retrovirus-related pol polyprotein from transposon TNT 1-94 n=1 Tax=Tanacetum coccineum TaxID=301880 RepID=A0ABQ5E2G7_9ASTR